MVGIVVAKIQNQPIHPLVTPRQNGAKCVFLLPSEIAFVFRDLVGIQVGAIGVVMLEAVHEPQHNDHQHVGNQVARQGQRSIGRKRGEYSKPHQDDRNVSTELVASLRNDESGEHHNGVHQNAVRRDKAPFKEDRDAVYKRVLSKKAFIIKPHHVVVLDVMPEVLGTNVFHRAVAGPANPPEPTRQLIVVPIHRENGVVGALMDHIGGNNHAVAEKQYAGDKTRPAA